MAAKNIYLFTGNDFLARRRMLRGWIREFEKKYTEMNVSIYDLDKEFSLAEISASLFAMPFLADKRCVVIRGFPFASTKKVKDEEESNAPDDGENDKEAELESLLLSCLERLPEHTFVLLESEAPDKRRKAAKRIMELAEEKTFVLKDGAPQGIKELLELLPVSLRRSVEERIPHTVGSAVKDLEKLIMLQEARPLTKEDIPLMMPVKLEQDAFLLSRAMVEKDAKTLFQGMMRLKANNEVILQFMGLLLWQLEQVIVVKSALESGQNEQEAMRELNMKPYTFGQAKQAARRSSMEFLQGLLEDLVEMDTMLKTGRASITDPESFTTLGVMLTQRMNEKVK